MKSLLFPFLRKAPPGRVSVVMETLVARGERSLTSRAGVPTVVKWVASAGPRTQTYKCRMRFSVEKLVSRTLTSSTAASTVTVEKLVSRDDVDAFAELSGDTNPVHFTGDAIVHGALLNGFVSGVIGTKLPGPGTVLVSQDFKFPNPCHVGDTIVIRVTVEEIRKITVCKYVILRKADGKCLMEGTAKVILKKPIA